jgi:hypothetical protein
MFHRFHAKKQQQQQQQKKHRTNLKTLLYTKVPDTKMLILS